MTDQPFTPRAVIAVILVGVFAFAAFVVLSAYAPELRSGRDGRAHALSRSAVGFAALVRLARDTGLPVQIDRGRGTPGAEDGLRIITLESGGDPKPAREAVADTSAGVTLVILPKWQVGPDLAHPGWVSRLGPMVTGQATSMLPETVRPILTRRAGTVAPGLRDVEEPDSGDVPPHVGRIEALQTFTAARGFRPLIVDDQGGALLVQATSDRGLYILSDPDLMNTQGLKDPNRALLALRVLNILSDGGPVVFDVSLNGFQASQDLLKLALEPPFLAATLCALAAAALMGWHAAARFGAPRRSGRALALGKSALADNSAALLRLAKREHRMAAPYADLTVRAVARAVGAPRGLDHAQTLELLDRLGVKAGAPLSATQLTAQARTVSDPAGLLALARRLSDWRRLMTRERT